MKLSLFAAIAVAALAPVAAAKDVTIKWHGQSFFEIKSSAGTTLAIDPHNLDAYGRIQVKADAVLISHYHIDHAALDPIVNVRGTRIIYGLKNKKGFDGNRRDDEFANVNEKVKDIQVRSLGAYHDDIQGMKRGKNTIFILEVDGLRIVHLGDLGHKLPPSTVKKLGQVDVLMVPVGGSYTLNGAEAKEVVAQIKPRRYILPMHYGTAVYKNLLGPEEFLDEQDPKLIKRFKTNELIIDADAVPRKNPTIALLNYEGAEDKPKDKDK